MVKIAECEMCIESLITIIIFNYCIFCFEGIKSYCRKMERKRGGMEQEVFFLVGERCTTLGGTKWKK